MVLPEWIRNADPGPNMRIPGEPGPIDQANYQRYLSRAYQDYLSEGLKLADELRPKVANFDTPKTIAEWKVAFSNVTFAKNALDGVTPETLGIKATDKVTFQQLLEQMFKVAMGLPVTSNIETADDKQKTALLLLIGLAVILLVLKKRR